ncbi:MAG TPA: F0F1 ATP synthase subunit B [Casimicrobiaceae bacterium]|nr:F0F1 ATP synthase subunit B [Casimicrobiaceae bacterium]
MNINLTLIMQAIAFTIFIWLCAKWIWPPLTNAIAARQKTIADGLAAGEQGRENLASAERRVGELVAEARAKAQEIVAQGEKQRSETVAHAKTEAQAEADRIVAAAKAELAQEVARAKEELRRQVSTLAIAGAGKILKREVDAGAHAAMLRDIEAQL